MCMSVSGEKTQPILKIFTFLIFYSSAFFKLKTLKDLESHKEVGFTAHGFLFCQVKCYYLYILCYFA